MRRAIDPDPREEKLPKWAQEKLSSLRQKVKETRHALNQELYSGISPDEPSVGVGMDVETSHPAKLYPKHERVKFRFGKGIGNYIECNMVNDIHFGKRLVVRGGDMVTIHPEASNTVSIKMERYDD